MSTLRQLALSRFAKVKRQSKVDEKTVALVKKLSVGMKQQDSQLLEEMIMRVDTTYLRDRKLVDEAINSIAKTMVFLGFYDDNNHLKVKDANGKMRSCLDAFGDLMAVRMRHTEIDRDLVVMRHNFVIEN